MTIQRTLILGGVITILAMALQLVQSVQTWEISSLDLVRTKYHTPHPDIVIVAIDNKSMYAVRVRRPRLLDVHSVAHTRSRTTKTSTATTIEDDDNDDDDQDDDDDDDD